MQQLLTNEHFYDESEHFDVEPRATGTNIIGGVPYQRSVLKKIDAHLIIQRMYKQGLNYIDLAREITEGKQKSGCGLIDRTQRLISMAT